MTVTLSMQRNGTRRHSAALVRAVSALASAAALVVLAPVILVVAAVILLETGRPVFFRQKRLGQHGTTFEILKFKKFHHAVDAAGPHLTSRNDARMTRVGLFLQRTKLDELPQFFNVLRGEMAIIGPRPESLRFADCFDGPFREVLDFKPGIFGPNQVLFRHEDALFAGREDVENYYRFIVFPLKAAVDIRYFSQRSTLSDMRLLIGTLCAIVGAGTRTEHLILGADAETRSPDRMPQTSARRLSHRHTSKSEPDRVGATP